MRIVTLKIIGCGDAFGTGGLHATCFYLETEHHKCLLDIGSGSLPVLKDMSINPSDIDLICLTHFHGAHFGGLPNFLLDATFTQRRQRELTIIGPVDVENKVWELQEAMYGGTSAMDFGFPIIFKQYSQDQSLNLSEYLSVEAVAVVHSEQSNPRAVKINIEGRSIVYTGDTEWTDQLLLLTKDCNVLISECFGWEGPMKYHLSYQEIIANIDRIGAERTFLTHLGHSAFDRQGEMELTVLKPGMEIEV